jgi:hypothetical protein
MAQVVAAFHDTRFAVPALRIQPAGNVTLVNLPTYFELAWSPGGFQPGQVDHPDPAQLLGYRVEIRPLLRDITYVYGDGQVDGPTTRTGGPFPSGDVRHEYRTPGDVVVRADVTLGGQFRVVGGPWIDIPAQGSRAGCHPDPARGHRVGSVVLHPPVSPVRRPCQRLGAPSRPGDNSAMPQPRLATMDA